MTRWLVLLLVVVIVVPSRACAVEASVTVSASASTIAVGDALTVTVTWSWPVGATPLREPDPAQDFRECFVTDVPPLISTRTAEGERRSQRLTLAATRSGAWALPRPSLTISSPAGPQTVQAAPVIVQVGTEAAPPHLPAAAALRLRAPISEQIASRAPRLIGAVAVAVVVIGGCAWWWWRRRHRFEQVPPGQLFASAMIEINQIADRADEPRGKEFAAALSLAVRRYVGAQWRFDGAGSTTREVAARLVASPDDDERRALLRLLERLDDQRWAAGSLTVTEVKPLADEAATWVAGVERRLAAEALAARQRAPAEAA
jgi:hypothetical protein